MLHASLFTLLLVFIGSSTEIQVDAKPISGPRYNAPHPHYNRTRDFQPRAATTTTYASAASASAAYLKQAQDAEAGRNSGWTAVGCYKDSPTRTLNGLFISSGNMSTKVCMNTCFGKGYTYGGVQYGQECWCGNKINSGTWYGIPPDQYIKSGDTYGTIVPYAECQAMPCSGDASTACGSNWRNTIFMLSDPNAASSAIAWSSSVSAASTSASLYSASSASAASASAKAYSTSAAAYSVSAAAYSSSSLSAAQASAAVYSSSSLAASASAYSALTRAAGAYSTSASQYSASAAAYSASSASVASASAAAYSAAAAQYSQQQSAIAYSASSQAAAQSAAAYSQSAAAYSQSSQAAAQSAAAYSTRAAAFSQSQSAAAYSQSAAAYSQSAAAYSQSAAAYSQSSQAAAQSAAAYSQSVAAYSQSAAAYSQSAAAYSQSVASAQAQSSSAAAYSASVKAASDAQWSSASAYSASVQYAQASASAAAYSESARQAEASASAYSASVAGAAYSASVQSAQAAASAAAYSASVQQAESSAAAYSASVSSAAAAAASASAAALEATKLPSTWSMARTQCIAEGSTGRALTGSSIASPGMSLGQCVKYCNDQGFVLAGIEYSQECYCGNVLEHGASLNRPSSQCNMKCGGSDDTCGGPNAITLMVSNAAVQSLSDDFTSKPVTLQDGWQVASTACVAEGTTGRALTGASFADDSMLPAKCMSFCKDKGFRLAGVEYGRECYCGSELSSGASLDRPADNCNVPCAGNPSLIGSCGGGGSLSLFSNPTLGSSQDAATASASQAAAAAQSSSAAAFTASLPSGWSVASSACIEEVGGRALTGASTAGGDMTVPMCISYCAGKGFSMAGLEYGGECYCANGLSNGASMDRTSGNCNMKCNGNGDSICGGPSAISLFVGPATAGTGASASPVASVSSSAAGSAATPTGPQPASNLPAGWSSVGGIAEVPGRALTGYSISTGNMTIQGCIDICSSKGFSLAAVEYGSECYCDNQFRNGASGDKTSNQCTMGCAGDQGTICGGPDCLSVYTNPNVQAPTPSSPASDSTPAASASATASASASSTPAQQDMTGIATNLPSGWSVGPSSCIQEVAGRALVGASTQSNSMTPLQCVQFCSDRGFSMVGLEYGGECYCGNELSNGASFDLKSGECKMPCNGDSSLVCGGPNGINMYINKDAAATSENTGGIPTGWKAADTACIQEVAGRALNAYSVVQDDMTIAKCLNICADKGYSLAGIEYGQECYCDNALQNSASLDKASDRCTMMCPGNVIDEGKCGGPDALSLFQRV